MNLNGIKALKGAVMNKTARQILLTQKHSPKILFFAGTVGMVGTVVLACRATMKTGDILDAHEVAFDDIKKRSEPELPVTDEKHARVTKEFHKLQIQTAAKIAKTYLPAVGLGIVSIGALAGGQIILTKRNGTLMAAYVGLDRAYNEYRSRVADKYGEDEDRLFASTLERKTVEEKMADGTVKKTDKLVATGKHGGSPYAAVFDETSTHFSKAPGANANTLYMIQSHATDKLRARGHLFLNEVLDMLGLPRKPAGQIVGWIWAPNNPDHKGDNYVTFGIWDNDDDFVQSFMDGHEKAIWLDFNVDGPIYESI